MDLLLETCLHFCYTKANEVLAGPANMACLNDSVLTRLAGMFSNAEVEQLRDRKDRLQGRLYCKLISSLAEPSPEEHRGHLASLARVFRCSECGKLVGSRSLAPRVACTPANTRLGRTGDLQYVHIRLEASKYTFLVGVVGQFRAARVGLKAELRSWRRVYWRLWGEAHWLLCTRCGSPFPLSEAAWCRQHPEAPQFLGAPPQRACGRYTCCGARGCQYESHAPELSTEKEQTVWSVFQEHMNLIVMPPPAMTNTSAERRARTPRVDAPPPIACSSGARSSCSSSSSSSASSGDEGPEDEDECAQACQPVRVTARPRTALLLLHATTPTTAHSFFISSNNTYIDFKSRFLNITHKREYTERAARRLVNWLSRRSCATVHARSHAVTSTPLGGTFVALEREWRDTHLRPDKPSTSSGRHRVRSSRLTS
ncbi:hypothetical protein B566_EDAN008315 [Ephemera danica]|nr:hypothetical protein B566_EDAN008315 [Ephemera danica]